MTGILKARFMEGLVLWLPMTEGAGTVVRDQSKYQNNGVFGAGGAAPSWVVGRDGLPSVDFDGTADLIDVLDHTSLRVPTFSMVVSVNFTAINDWEIIFTKRTDANNRFELWKDNQNRIYISLSTGSSSSDVLETVASLTQANTWYRLGFSYNDPDWIMYVNGLQSKTGEYAGGIGLNFAEDMEIGARTVIGDYYDGMQDGFGIYNRALDPYEFRADFEMIRKI